MGKSHPEEAKNFRLLGHDSSAAWGGGSKVEVKNGIAYVGTLADVVARFEALQALGVTDMIVAMPFTLEERYAIIETLGREVLPRLGVGRP